MGVFFSYLMYWTGVWFWGGILVTLGYLALISWSDRGTRRWQGRQPVGFEERECFLSASSEPPSLEQYRDASIDALADLQRIERGVCRLMHIEPQDGSRLYDDIVSAVRDGQGWSHLFEQYEQRSEQSRALQAAVA